MKSVYDIANELVQCYVDRAGAEKAESIISSVPWDVGARAREKARIQCLMILFKDYRYFGWCRVRPDYDKRT